MYPHSILEEVFFEAADFTTQENSEMEAEIIKTDTRIKIADTLKAPFRYICSVRLDGATSGSGTLIGPRTVLTAGHVVWDDSSNKKLKESRLAVVPALNGSKFPKAGTGVYAVSNIILSKAGFSKNNYSGPVDYAIIRLKEPAGLKYGFWGMKQWQKHKVRTTLLSQKALPLPAGTLKVNLCGYPADGDKSDRMGDHQWLAYDRTAKFSDGGKILEYLNDSFGGHSGSPVWVRRHSSMGGRVLVGIHISGRVPDGSGKISKGNRAVFLTQSVRQFIAANIL